MGRVNLDELLNTGRFDYAKAHQHPLWFKELYGFEEHSPETEEYGIRSFVYRARQPFDPEKFHVFINSEWPGVIRSKGHFWLATRPNWVGELSQAGAIVRNEALGFWWAAVPRDRWPDHQEWRQSVERQWDPLFGDRRQELVFIGASMDEATLREKLDACLVAANGSTDFAIESKAWKSLVDPFPAWSRENEE